MLSKVERFWITIILRFSFGFFFLFACIAQFNYGVDNFAKTLSGPIAQTWIGDVEASIVSTFSDVEFADASRDWFLITFMQCVPYLLCALSVCILTGILLRPALRVGALLMIVFALGKYLTNDLTATANDFLFALIICIGLYFLSIEKKESSDSSAYAAA